jgi:hypothetical protein
MYMYNVRQYSTVHEDAFMLPPSDSIMVVIAKLYRWQHLTVFRLWTWCRCLWYNAFCTKFPRVRAVLIWKNNPRFRESQFIITVFFQEVIVPSCSNQVFLLHILLIFKYTKQNIQNKTNKREEHIYIQSISTNIIAPLIALSHSPS